MPVERAILAEEARARNLQFVQAVQGLLPGVTLEFVPHSELKSLIRQARAIVRTGEFAPYANVLLVSGVVF